MKSTSKAVYLGNTNGEYYGFTVGNTYSVNYFEIVGENCFWCSDDDGVCRYIKNGAFHKFEICEDGEGFITEAECADIASVEDKEPKLRYYINGHEVEVFEFEDVRVKVGKLDHDGVKCDTIKFEVKFE